MAELNYDFSKGETDYSDGPVENEMLKIAKSTQDFEAVAAEKKDWPIYVSFSHLRENLYNWYPFKKNGSLLEVGCGCGALTGLFCRSVNDVTAVELTDIRAKVNYERNRNCDNLTIYVADIFKISFQKKFDYIVLTGVLEYAAYMCPEKDPYRAMLLKLKSLLKPDGHLLIAIENRLGIKYFAGAKEDHTGRIFDGINGYPDNSRVRTFSRAELSHLIRECGFGESKFYYPYPDYKFPQMIYTDRSARKFDGSCNYFSLDKPRIAILDELRITKTLAEEGIFGEFANSFLVDIGPDDNNIAMVKLSCERKNQYRLATGILVGSSKSVVKKAISAAAEPHIRKMYDVFLKYGCVNHFPLSKCRICGRDSVEFEYLEGSSVQDLLTNCVRTGDSDYFDRIIEEYHRRLFDGSVYDENYRSDGFAEIFGPNRWNGPLHYSPVSSLDLMFQNIFVVNGVWKQTDYEWVFDFPIPLEYIFWRAVYFFRAPYRDMRELREAVFGKFGISAAMSEIFMDWEKSFDAYVISKDNYRNHNCGIIPIDLNVQLPKLMENQIISRILYDVGQGITEQTIVPFSCCSWGKPCTVKMLFPGPVRAIRFIPANAIQCFCVIKDVTTNLGTLQAQAVNAVPVVIGLGGDIFLTDDPIYRLTGDLDGIEWVQISFSIFDLRSEKARNAIAGNNWELNHYMRRQEEQIAAFIKESAALKEQAVQLKAEKDAKREQVDRLTKENAALKAQCESLDAVLHSRSWKVTKPLRSLGLIGRKLFGMRK